MGKFYWLKLKNDYFTQPKIKKLRKIAGGDTYTIIYLKLQLLSLENDGKLFFEGIEESFVEELALTLDEDVENVNITIQYLLRQGLLEEKDMNEYLMTETQTLIGSETAAAARKRKSRERLKAQKQLQICDNVTAESQAVTNSHIEIEKEIELEIENREEIDNGSNEPNTSSSTALKKKAPKHRHGEFKNVLLTDDELKRLKEEYGKEVISKAIKKLDEYIEESGKKYKNHNLTIRRWVIDAVTNDKPKKGKDLNNFDSRDYDMDDLERMLSN